MMLTQYMALWQAGRGGIKMGTGRRALNFHKTDTWGGTLLLFEGEEGTVNKRVGQP